MALSRITSSQKESGKPSSLKTTSLIQDLFIGFQYAFNHTDLRLLMLLSLFASLFIRPYLDFLPGFSDDVFNKGKEGLTVLTAVSGIGSMAFATYFAIRGRAQGLVSVLYFCQISATIALIFFSILDQFVMAILARGVTLGYLMLSSFSVIILNSHFLSLQ